MGETEHITVAETSDGPGGSRPPGEEVALPVVELLTGRGFVTGKSGAGKSNSASVLVEQLLDNEFGLLIVDVDGEYYGLKEAYEILHVGADEECDIQVTTDHAERLAGLALEQNVPIILDVSSFLDESEAEALLTEVARHLFAKAKKQKQPFLLLVEEIHEYIPEQGSVGECGQMLIKIGKRGRKHGLGVCGISQRPADVKKDFITQCDWLLWHRLTWQNDTRVVRRILDGEYADAVENLDNGEGFLVTDWTDDVRRVQFYRKETFDAGATPGLEDVERPELKSVSADLVEELEEISDEQTAREDRIAELEATLERKEARIEELERELRDARDLQDLAEQFVDALTRHGDDDAAAVPAEGTDETTSAGPAPGEAAAEWPGGWRTSEAAPDRNRATDTSDAVTADPAVDEATDEEVAATLASLAGVEGGEPTRTDTTDGRETESPEEFSAERILSRLDDVPSAPDGDSRGNTTRERSHENTTRGRSHENTTREDDGPQRHVTHEGDSATRGHPNETDGSRGHTAREEVELEIRADAEVIEEDDPGQEPSGDSIGATSASGRPGEHVLDPDASPPPAGPDGESGSDDAPVDGRHASTTGTASGPAGAESAEERPADGDSAGDEGSETAAVDAPAATMPEEEPLVVRELKADIGGMDTKTRRMLAFYREHGPASAQNAHFAAGGDGDRTKGYARNRTLRTRGLVEHVGRGRYDYCLREHLAEELGEHVDPAVVDAYAAEIEATALSA